MFFLFCHPNSAQYRDYMPSKLCTIQRLHAIQTLHNTEITCHPNSAQYRDYIPSKLCAIQRLHAIQTLHNTEITYHPNSAQYRDYMPSKLYTIQRLGQKKKNCYIGVTRPTLKLGPTLHFFFKPKKKKKKNRQKNDRPILKKSKTCNFFV